MKDKPSNLLTGFTKNHSTQYCLISMFEMWKDTLDKGGYGCRMLMDLSKAFDTLNHNLLIVKLEAYGFERKSLSLMKSYLSDRQQQVRVNDNFSSWENIITGVPQGTLLGPLLFNIFFNASGFNLEEVKNFFCTDFDAVTRLFYENCMTLNAGKCHFMCRGNDTANETFIFKKLVMKNSKEQNIFDVTIDNKLNSKSHIKELCKKGSQKYGYYQGRLSNYLNNSEKKLVFNSIVKSQFNYCPLVWTFCSRTSINMINKELERALRVVLNDYTSDFKTLLQRNNDVCNHQRNIKGCFD